MASAVGTGGEDGGIEEGQAKGEGARQEYRVVEEPQPKGLFPAEHFFKRSKCVKAGVRGLSAKALRSTAHGYLYDGAQSCPRGQCCRIPPGVGGLPAAMMDVLCPLRVRAGL